MSSFHLLTALGSHVDSCWVRQVIRQKDGPESAFTFMNVAHKVTEDVVTAYTQEAVGAGMDWLRSS